MNIRLTTEEVNTTYLFLHSLKEKLNEVARYYYNDELVEGNNKIINVIDDFNIIISGTNTIFYGLYDIATFSSLLSELVEAMESQDNVLIADLLTYEFTPIISNLEEVFEKQKA